MCIVLTAIIQDTSCLAEACKILLFSFKLYTCGLAEAFNGLLQHIESFSLRTLSDPSCNILHVLLCISIQ